MGAWNSNSGAGGSKTKANEARKDGSSNLDDFSDGAFDDKYDDDFF